MIGFGLVFAISFDINFESEASQLHPSFVKIGIVRWIDDSEYDKNIAGFKMALTENGFEEGKNIEYITKISKGEALRQQSIIEDFVDSDVDLIYSLTTPGTIIAMSNNQIPIVFSIVTFPIEAGIVNSLDSRIVVGTSNYVSVEEQLDPFLSIVSIKKLGFVHSNEPNSNLLYQKMNEYANSIGIEVIDLKISSQETSRDYLSNSIDSVDAFYQACDTMIQNGVEEIAIGVASAAGKPTFTCNKEGVYYGALIGTITDFQSLGSLSGIQAASILKGHEIPSSSVIQSSEKYCLVNTKTAEMLGIKIPQLVLEEADELIDWRI